MRLLLAGGGSGGHIFQAQAVADRLQKIDKSSKILFVGAKRGLESKLVPEMGYDLAVLPVHPLKGQNPLLVIWSLVLIPVSLIKSFLILFKFKPDVVLGVGGYASGPVILACWLLKPFKKIVISMVEINSVPGFTNKIISKFSQKIYLSDPNTKTYFNEKKCEVVGAPVRESLIQQFYIELQARSKTRNLSVVGGSQGALGMNSLIIAALKSSEKIKSAILSGSCMLTHQCGKLDYDRMKDEYESMGIFNSQGVDLQPFIQNMAKLYANTDLLICRAGASTLSEISVLKIPSILIPLPTAADNHQEKNARLHEKTGGALVILESEQNVDELREILEEVLFDPEKTHLLKKALENHPVKNASELLVDSLFESITA